ncbi:MAG TPA: SH3 domain-containing protein [Coleofasciculaceae cyanobacterium]|jgi:hypothetical protein
MKQISHWDKRFLVLALVLSTMSGMNANATVLTSIGLTSMIIESEPTVFHKRSNFKLAQGLVGTCRAATRSVFIYQERSTANRLRALQPDEQVILAEEKSRSGWIAISSPISGFVQTKDLKRCFDAGEEKTSPASNLCRQVRYSGNEGVAVRVSPDKYSRQVNSVFFQDRVKLSNPPQFIEDNEGRQWVRIIAPSVGWISNGFLSDNSNLEACF